MKHIFFGSIGVLAETSNIQRACYNKALSEFDTGLYWNVATYCQLLQKPGGILRLESLGIAPDIAQKIHARKQALYPQMLDDIQPRAGISALLADCLRDDIGVSFVTTTTKETIAALETALMPTINFDIFQQITTMDDVKISKPAPDIYLHAARKLGVEPQDILVIEDSMANVKAAQNAGMCAYFFPGEFALNEVMKADMADISLAKLQAVFDAKAPGFQSVA